MSALEKCTLTATLSITLRIANKEDIPKLEWYGQYRHYRNLFRRAYREQQRGRRLILIADSRGFPIGHIFIHLYGSNRINQDGVQRAYFYSLRVMEMLRGYGIGTHLILEAEQIVMQHGFRRAAIAVAKDNHAARRLYERLGYRVFRHDSGEWNYRDHQGKLHHVREPSWIMEKLLIHE